MGRIEGVEPVDHDGNSHIKINSSMPIECQGDAEVLSQVYPQEIGVGNLDRVVNSSQDLTRTFSKLRQFMPFDDFQQINKTLKRANRKNEEIRQRYTGPSAQ